MTVWVLQQQEEAAIERRERLLLPFGEVPDLSGVQNQGQLRQMLSALHADAPPESINRRIDQLWHLYHDLLPDDVIAVPLASMQEVALAQVNGRYGYEVGPDGTDTHTIPVRWHRKRIPLSKLGKHRIIFTRKEPMFEVTDAEERNALRSFLPHGYNRFARIKWLAAALLLLQAAMMFFSRQ